MNSLMMVAGAIGFTPSLLLLFYTLRDYTYPATEKPYFDDRPLFLMFTFGLILGSILFVVESFFGGTVLIYVILVVLIEEMLKFIIFNSSRFSGKIDTTFYALSFGLGLSSTLTFGNVYLGLSGAMTLGVMNVFGVLLFLIFGFMIAFLRASTTALIGLGASKKDPLPYTLQAIMIHLFFSIVLIPFFMNLEPWNYVSFAAVAVFMTYVYYLTHNFTVPSTIPFEARPPKWKKTKM